MKLDLHGHYILGRNNELSFSHIEIPHVLRCNYHNNIHYIPDTPIVPVWSDDNYSLLAFFKTPFFFMMVIKIQKHFLCKSKTGLKLEVFYKKDNYAITLPINTN